MADLPVMLKVHNRRCVIVGGGSVALRRAKSLLDAGAQVTVIAPQIMSELVALRVTTEQRPYQAGDLEGAMLAVAATDDPTINEQVASEARIRRILINRVDRSINELSQEDELAVAIPAHAQHGPVTLAVHTGGISARAAAEIRDQLGQALDPMWINLLEIVAPYRVRIQSLFPDVHQRQDRLTRLTNTQAKLVLREQGAAGLIRYCEGLLVPD